MRIARNIPLLGFVALGVASPLSSQEVLPRWGEESQTMYHRSADIASDSAAVVVAERQREQVDSLRRLGGGGDWVQLIELRFARMGIPNEYGCLLPTDRVSSVGRGDVDWPANAETRFVVLSDPGANIVYFEEIAGGCNGGAPVTYQYYFDWSARAVLFRRSAEVLPGCAAAPAQEVTTYYYDAEKGSLVGKEYSLKTESGQELAPDACDGFYHREPYSIGRTWNDVVSLRLRGLREVPG